MPVEHAGWMRRSRFLGAMRYHGAWLGRLFGWALMFFLAGNAIAIAAALAGAGDLNMAGVSSDFSLTMALLLVCACLAAHSRTRFLLRFGTARFPVWLSNVLALFLGAAAFLLGTLLINLATGGTVQLLSRIPCASRWKGGRSCFCGFWSGPACSICWPAASGAGVG